jgi:GDPmannose 4,6-dehydratase
MSEFQFGTDVGVKFAYEKGKAKKTACISGITGQDGSFMAELLLSKGYEVHGIVRRCSTSNTRNIDAIKSKLILHYGDICDGNFIDNLCYEIQPHEFYHLAAQSHVGLSFEIPVYTSEVVAMGTMRILEALHKYSPYTKLYFAGTSELFGSAEPAQNELTPMVPNNPYAIGKLFGLQMSQLYRKSYGMFIACGILFNHESERRGDEFVTQKIIKGLIKCKQGKQEKLYLGNLDSKRDWGHSKEYMEAAWLMLQQPEPDDFVIGTGEASSIRDFLNVAGDYIKIEWKEYVEVDSNLFRPTETSYLLADPKKAMNKLGWQSKIKLSELIKIMVDYQLLGGNN